MLVFEIKGIIFPLTNGLIYFSFVQMDIKGKLKNLPQSSGVYIMKDRRGKPLYIGKAKSLSHRLRYYFQESSKLPRRMRAMVSKVEDFEVIITDSEIEALILESNLIKENKPRYNVNLKDDKRYPLIKVTVGEKFPRVIVVRRAKRDGAKYFGPYTNAKSMRWTLRMLRRIFPVRSCSQPLPVKGKSKPCLNFYIKRCLGVCQGNISQEDYKKIIDSVLLFLSGRNKVLEEHLKGAMEEAARMENFELAAKFRDQLRAVEKVTQYQKIVTQKEVDRDIISYARQERDAASVLLKVRGGAMVGREHFYFTLPSGVPDEEFLASLLKRTYLNSADIPAEVILPQEIEDGNLIGDWLSRRRGGKVNLAVPQRGEKAKLIGMAKENAQLLLEELLLERSKAKKRLSPGVLALQGHLHLKKAPRRIEAFDISNIRGSDAVGSMVSFLNGRPRKSSYRRFKIKMVAGQDDYGMMKEVIRRRYKRILQENGNLPDLVLVDGGKGQLSAAREALRGEGIEDQPIIGLAKRLDEVFLPGRSESIMLPKDSPALRLIQRVRDEAHRFAISYHRLLRKKRTIRSELGDIEGIGRRREEALLKVFGSLEGVKKAGLLELERVKGMNKRVAQSVYNYFHYPKEKVTDGS